MYWLWLCSTEFICSVVHVGTLLHRFRKLLVSWFLALPPPLTCWLLTTDGKLSRCSYAFAQNNDTNWDDSGADAECRLVELKTDPPTSKLDLCGSTSGFSVDQCKALLHAHLHRLPHHQQIPPILTTTPPISLDLPLFHHLSPNFCHLCCRPCC